MIYDKNYLDSEGVNQILEAKKSDENELRREIFDKLSQSQRESLGVDSFDDIILTGNYENCLRRNSDCDGTQVDFSSFRGESGVTYIIGEDDSERGNTLMSYTQIYPNPSEVEGTYSTRIEELCELNNCYYLDEDDGNLYNIDVEDVLESENQRQTLITQMSSEFGVTESELESITREDLESIQSGTLGILTEVYKTNIRDLVSESSFETISSENIQNIECESGTCTVQTDSNTYQITEDRVSVKTHQSQISRFVDSPDLTTKKQEEEKERLERDIEKSNKERNFQEKVRIAEEEKIRKLKEELDNCDSSSSCLEAYENLQFLSENSNLYGENEEELERILEDNANSNNEIEYFRNIKEDIENQCTFSTSNDICQSLFDGLNTLNTLNTPFLEQEISQVITQTKDAEIEYINKLANDFETCVGTIEECAKKYEKLGDYMPIDSFEEKSYREDLPEEAINNEFFLATQKSQVLRSSKNTCKIYGECELIVAIANTQSSNCDENNFNCQVNAMMISNTDKTDFTDFQTLKPNDLNIYFSSEEDKEAFDCKEDNCGTKIQNVLDQYENGQLTDLDQLGAITSKLSNTNNEDILDEYMKTYETSLDEENKEEHKNKEKNEEALEFLLERTSTNNYMKFLNNQLDENGTFTSNVSSFLSTTNIIDYFDDRNKAQNNILDKFREEVDNEPECKKIESKQDMEKCNSRINIIYDRLEQSCDSLPSLDKKSCQAKLDQDLKDVKNAKEYIEVDKMGTIYQLSYNFFKYFSKQDEAFNLATGDKYYNPMGISEETLTFLKEPYSSVMCIGLTHGISFDDVFTNDGNIGDQTLEGEELFDFRGSVINLVPQDKNNLEYSGYAKYSYFFKAPPKARAGDLDEVDDNPVKELSKRRLAVMLLYNKKNISEDAENNDYVGYYTTISDPQIIELSPGQTKSSGIKLKEVTEVYGDKPNFRIVVFYRDYFKHQNEEKREDNLRIWTSSDSKPSASVLGKLKKVLPIIVDSSTNNDLESSASDEASSSGETSPDNIEDDIIDDI